MLRAQRSRIRDQAVADGFSVRWRQSWLDPVKLIVVRLLDEEVVITVGDEPCLASLTDELGLLSSVVGFVLRLHLVKLLEVLH